MNQNLMSEKKKQYILNAASMALLKSNENHLYETARRPVLDKLK